MDAGVDTVGAGVVVTVGGVNVGATGVGKRDGVCGVCGGGGGGGGGAACAAGSCG